MDPRGDRPRGGRLHRPAPGAGVQDPEPAEGEQDLARGAARQARRRPAGPRRAARPGQRSAPGSAQEPAGAGARAARPSGRGQRVGRVVRPCRVELPVVQSASLDWGKRVAFLGVDLRDNRGAAKKLLREIPLTYPSYEDPDGKVSNGYRLVGYAQHDLLRRRGQADLHPHRARTRTARSSTPTSSATPRRDRGPPGARSVRDRRRAGAALRGLLRRAGRQPGGGARRARRRGAAARRGGGRRGRRHLPPAGRGLRGQARAHGGRVASHRGRGLAADAARRGRGAGARAGRAADRARRPAQPRRPSTSEPATPRTATCSSTRGSST